MNGIAGGRLGNDSASKHGATDSRDGIKPGVLFVTLVAWELPGVAGSKKGGHGTTCPGRRFLLFSFAIFSFVSFIEFLLFINVEISEGKKLGKTK